MKKSNDDDSMDDQVTKHEIAAHERLETIVKKEQRTQEKRDIRDSRRMRHILAKKKHGRG